MQKMLILKFCLFISMILTTTINLNEIIKKFQQSSQLIFVVYFLTNMNFFSREGIILLESNLSNQNAKLSVKMKKIEITSRFINLVRVQSIHICKLFKICRITNFHKLLSYTERSKMISCTFNSSNILV